MHDYLHFIVVQFVSTGYFCQRGPRDYDTFALLLAGFVFSRALVAIGGCYD